MFWDCMQNHRTHNTSACIHDSVCSDNEEDDHHDSNDYEDYEDLTQ